MVQQLASPPTIDAPLRMSYEEFLEWAKDHPHAEWVDGEVIEFMTVKRRHTLVVAFLMELFRAYVRFRQLGEVFGDPYSILVRDGRSSRQPDIGVILTANLDRFTEDQLEGPADLVIEVISDESVTNDRRLKLADYADAGVPEYWIVEGRAGRQGVDLHVRNAKGRYERVLPDSLGHLNSTVLPEFWIDPAWLAADPLPDVDLVLESIVPGILLERAKRAQEWLSSQSTL